MNPIEIAVSLLAPHTCIVCKREGLPLCRNCAVRTLTPLPPQCYRCGQGADSPKACISCALVSPLRHVWLGTAYAGAAKDAIRLLKFSRAKAMAVSLAESLNTHLPELPGDTLVTHAPTAYARIRTRGYDQARLIAKAFAKKRHLRYVDILRRTTTTRQVGATRTERFGQLHNAFTVRNTGRVIGAPVLLIDDVLTTGATLESAATTLRDYGAKTVDAAVVAHALKAGLQLTAMSSSSTRSAQG